MTAGTAGAQPYKLVGAALGTAGTAAAGTSNSEYAVTAAAVTAATRGQNTNSGADYTKIAPIGCIDASVAFLETKIYSTMVAVTVGGPRRQPQPGNTWSSSPVTPRGTLVSQKTQIPWHKTPACTTWGGGLLGPLPALPPGLPPPTVIRCLRTVATNQLPQPQLAGTLPRP